MDRIITTPCGPVRGCPGNLPGITAFKGIRYATAGRWEYPVQVKSWTGVYDATGYGACCYQPRAFRNESEMPGKAFYYNEFRKGETYRYSEDCLFLNVWVPDAATPTSKLPVLLYIHGGGFTGGCGHEKHFDGPIWPTKGVVSVTINYRLGPLGFLCLPELEEEAGRCGNYGLYDQLAALRWVKDNISAFGGDSDNITIMGQSAGAMSVQQHCLSPLSQGLFGKAIMSSGGGFSKLLSPSLPKTRFDFWHAVMARSGCKTLAEFRTLPAEQLFAQWQKANKEIKGSFTACSPCMDGNLIIGSGHQILKQGGLRPIPTLCGSTSEDVMALLIHKMATSWCKVQPAASYGWFFDRKLPGDKNGAWHSSDLWYWFGTLNNSWRPWEKKDQELTDAMTDYLANFVKTGDPNGHGLPHWEAMGKKQRRLLRLGEGEIRMDKVNSGKLLWTTLTNKAVGE